MPSEPTPATPATASLTVQISLRPDLERDRAGESGESLALRAGRSELRLGSGGGAERILREMEARRDEDGLRARALEAGGMRGLMLYQQLVDRLDRAGFLRRTLAADGEPLLDLEPVAAGAPAPGEALDGPAPLSRFALARRDGSGADAATLLLESPLGLSRVRLHGSRGAALLGPLMAGAPPEAVAAAGGLEAREGGRVLAWLDAAGLLAGEDEAADPALRSWEVHDLLFHARSRLGRRSGGYGGTYRFRGAVPELPEPPVLRPPLSGNVVELAPAPLDELCSSDVPFARVVEERRSVREQGEPPLTVQELGRFLHRSARVREHLRNEKGEVAHRVYPGGGAIYELEVYPVVDRVAGLEAGLWRYDPLGHRLERVAGRTPEVERLLVNAHHTVDRRGRPQVLLVLAARFQRMQWKYEGMAYAAILKHVGVLFEAFYLTATAMGLAPCALGGGDADLFAAASGLPYLEEGAVGEFVLGSMPGDAAS